MIRQIIDEAKKIVEPSVEERSRVYKVANHFVNVISNHLKDKYSDVEVSIQGSVAKDTWLPGNRDIDIFIILPKNYNYSIIDKIINELIDLAINKNLNWIMKYAEHPYIQFKYEDFDIDVVPCFKISMGEKPITPADRTPLHTQYIINKLSSDLKIEVRLLKKFLKIINVYGAEIKVEGFSGYLTELLILHYGSFLKTIQEIANNWRPGKVIIDIEKHYSDRSVVKKMFRESSLIVIDPIDSKRNVAAAVSKESMAKLIAACKWFLHKPSIQFFRDECTLSIDLSVKALPPVLVMTMNYPEKTSPDIVWGELKKLSKCLVRNLRKMNFNIYTVDLWSDEEKNLVIMITLEKHDLTPHELHEGPPTYSNASLKFIEKYLNDSEALGPFIIGSRWYVIRRRKVVHVEDAVKSVIRILSLKHLPLSTLKFYRVERVEDLDKVPENIKDVVYEHIIKRPKWLCY